MTVGVVETNDGGSARVWQDFAPIAVELGYSTDTPDASARTSMDTPAGYGRCPVSTYSVGPNGLFGTLAGSVCSSKNEHE